jgi:hypothetical protein
MDNLLVTELLGDYSSRSMKLQLSSVFMFFAIIACTTRAATHYVCDCRQGSDADCVNGSDNATGQSKSTPWQTFDKAMQNFGAFAAGDTIAFARGAVFSTAGGRWVNYNAARRHRIPGPGDSQKDRIGYLPERHRFDITTRRLAH